MPTKTQEQQAADKAGAEAELEKLRAELEAMKVTSLTEQIEQLKQLQAQAATTNQQVASPVTSEPVKGLKRSAVLSASGLSIQKIVAGLAVGGYVSIPDKGDIFVTITLEKDVCDLEHPENFISALVLLDEYIDLNWKNQEGSGSKKGLKRR